MGFPLPSLSPARPKTSGAFRELFNEGVLIHVKSVIRTGVLTVAYRGPRRSAVTSSTREASLKEMPRFSGA
jgi:hypothetical protein